MNVMRLFVILFSLLVLSSSLFASTIPNPQSTPTSVKKINLNTADVAVLSKSFKGIGKKRAEAIVAYRNAHGAFKSIMDLNAVKGIGPSFVKAHLQQLEAVFSII